MTGQDEVEEEQAFTLFDDAPVKDDTDWAVVLLGQAEEFPLYIEPQRVWCAPSHASTRVPCLRATLQTKEITAPGEPPRRGRAARVEGADGGAAHATQDLGCVQDPFRLVPGQPRFLESQASA
jgi:hypothetical protein